MAIESGLYHRSQYDRSRPAGSCWEATGGLEPERVVPLRPGHAVDVAIVGGSIPGCRPLSSLPLGQSAP